MAINAFESKARILWPPKHWEVDKMLDWNTTVFSTGVAGKIILPTYNELKLE